MGEDLRVGLVHSGFGNVFVAQYFRAISLELVLINVAFDFFFFESIENFLYFDLSAGFDVLKPLLNWPTEVEHFCPCDVFSAFLILPTF